jgi:DnaJ-class molecular chaperone with C-terminal Zn finger domain
MKIAAPCSSRSSGRRATGPRTRSRRPTAKKASKWHPDKNKDPEAPKRFLLIREAYTVLSDAAMRKTYDAGGDVEEEREKRQAPDVEFSVEDIDYENGKMKVKWHDPATGEEGWIEMDIEKRKKGDKTTPQVSAAERRLMEIGFIFVFDTDLFRRGPNYSSNSFRSICCTVRVPFPIIHLEIRWLRH